MSRFTVFTIQGNRKTSILYAIILLTKRERITEWLACMLKRFLAITFLLISGPAFSQYEESQWNLEPKIGFWFGPVAPVPGTALADSIDTYLGGGIFGRVNIPTDYLRLETGISYQEFKSRDINSLTMVPAYVGLSYKIPLDFPIKFALRLGGGAVYVANEPEGHSNVLPLLNSGFELSFPAGRMLAIGLRVDYNLAYEKHLSPPPENPNFEIINGHFISFGLTLTVNMTRE